MAAWLLLKILTGQPLPGVEGTGTRLQMQTEAQRWDIDDILLTTTVSPEDQRHLAISCKSNRQVTRSGLPVDFVARCWQQWAKLEPNPIQKGKDCLMLVTRDWNKTFPETWSELKKDAPGSDLALALGRMRQTDKRRKVFDSVKYPARDAGVTVDDAEVIAMIDTIEVELVDFHTANSRDEKLAIRLARTLLVNNSHAEGKRLWTELVAQAEKTRLGP